MFTFTHAGKMGDILYSLYFCKEFSEHFNAVPFIYHIQTNRREKDFNKNSNNTEVMISPESAAFIKPLLEAQTYIREVLVGDEKPQGAIDLNSFRSNFINPFGCEIRDWYYNFGQPSLPREFWKPALHVEPSPKYKDKILVSLTTRYVNVGIDYKQLGQFKAHLAFIGTDREYETFQRNYFELERAPLAKDDTLLTAAQYLAGAKGFIANQSGFYSLAELMKINRILLTPDWVRDGLNRVMMGPKNNLPLGGWCHSVSFTPKVVSLVKDLLAM